MSREQTPITDPDAKPADWLWHDPEVANTVTHGLGFVLSLFGFYYLVELTLPLGDVRRLLAAAIYGATLVVLYGASTLAHSARTPLRRVRYDLFDHCAIYLLIAGTYTPLFLVAMGGNLGRAIVLGVWTIALAGVAFKLVCGTNRYIGWSLTSYLATGWLPLLVLHRLLPYITPAGVFWLVLGGVLYTVGVPFYLNKRFRYSHAVWHLFVVAASACHFRAVVYALMTGL